MNAGYSTTPLGERLADNSTPVKWEQINWKTVEKNVNKLQARIVKAVRQNKWHLVKRLQYLLTNSFHAKLLAVKKVTCTFRTLALLYHYAILKGHFVDIRLIKCPIVKYYCPILAGVRNVQ